MIPGKGTSSPLFSRVYPDAKAVAFIRKSLFAAGGGRIVWVRRHMTVTPNDVERMRKLLRGVLGGEGF